MWWRPSPGPRDRRRLCKRSVEVADPRFRSRVKGPASSRPAAFLMADESSSAGGDDGPPRGDRYRTKAVTRRTSPSRCSPAQMRSGSRAAAASLGNRQCPDLGLSGDRSPAHTCRASDGGSLLRRTIFVLPAFRSERQSHGGCPVGDEGRPGSSGAPACDRRVMHICPVVVHRRRR
jgi:hypothetical protein